MYALEQNLKWVEWEGKKILTLIQSINQPMVAAADYPAEETQAFIVTLQAPDRSLSTVIYFHLERSNRCVIYQYSESPFMGDRLVEAETQAVDFVESMGFMMDNLRFDKLPEDERQRLQKETPLFYRHLKEFEPHLIKRRNREEDPLATTPAPAEDAGAEEHVTDLHEMIEEASPIEEITREEPGEVAIDVNELANLNSISEEMRDPPLTEDVADPVDALDGLEFTEDSVPVLDSTVVLEKNSLPPPPPPPEQVKESAESSDEGFEVFFEPQEPEPVQEPESSSHDDLTALGEIENSLRPAAADESESDMASESPLETDAAPSPVAVSRRTPLTQEECKHLLGLLLSA